MSEDYTELSNNISNWIIKLIYDESMYTDLDLEDASVRAAVAEGLEGAAMILLTHNKTIH